jgi:hypothetical protein
MAGHKWAHHWLDRIPTHVRSPSEWSVLSWVLRRGEEATLCPLGVSQAGSLARSGIDPSAIYARAAGGLGCLPVTRVVLRTTLSVEIVGLFGAASTGLSRVLLKPCAAGFFLIDARQRAHESDRQNREHGSARGNLEEVPRRGDAQAGAAHTHTHTHTNTHKHTQTHTHTHTHTHTTSCAHQSDEIRVQSQSGAAYAHARARTHTHTRHHVHITLRRPGPGAGGDALPPCHSSPSRPAPPFTLAPSPPGGQHHHLRGLLQASTRSQIQ